MCERKKVWPLILPTVILNVAKLAFVINNNTAGLPYLI